MKKSAGILLFRRLNAITEVFLVHPGGPYFKNKNEGWWTIPKGEPESGEELLAAAIREFEEETGYKPAGPFTELAPIIQKGGKKVFAWACTGNIDPEKINCNDFEMQWPPRSGKMQRFPEVDKAGWFDIEKACILINEMQKDFLVQLSGILSGC